MITTGSFPIEKSHKISHNAGSGGCIKLGSGKVEALASLERNVMLEETQ